MGKSKVPILLYWIHESDWHRILPTSKNVYRCSCGHYYVSFYLLYISFLARLHSIAFFKTIYVEYANEFMFSSIKRIAVSRIDEDRSHKMLAIGVLEAKATSWNSSYLALWSWTV